ncbi:divalent-cation tolerance protein CutA [Lentzea sp. HUAS12]|uniref:divalent-cation tolerance protein CutA n=1 Tax=Lentzea sp. HUAS12 TaxID=2951806 RepID=UPI00209D5423|nr:divalent-cation tolerance protein CutA [Lentzea sp. HUAS12]USX51233.1 divalent-cation tolerance protein CutA [Lentzea sp. HUAS12]
MLRRVSDYLQVTVVADSKEVATSLARSAVTTRHAASAQIVGPITSVYWHQGELGEGQEWQAVLKTTTARYPALRDHLLSEHPWSNPEITAVEMLGGTDEYFEWLKRTVEPTD